MYLADTTVLSKNKNPEVHERMEQDLLLSKNLYNAALFRIRQVFTGWEKEERTQNEEEVFGELRTMQAAYPKVKVGRVLSYRALDAVMRANNNPDFFAGLPMQTAQRVLKEAVTVFRAWLSSLKEFRRAPERYTGKPCMPKYLKNDRHTFYITNQDAVLYPVYRKTDAAGRKITDSGAPGEYDGMELKLPLMKKRLYLRHIAADSRLKEVQVKPYYGKILLVLVLETEDPPMSREKPYLAGIDFGTDNIAAIVTTDRASRVYKGGAVLAKNRLFHKEKAKAVRILTKGKRYAHASSRHLDFISRKHDGFVRDVMHKVSADIVRFCKEHRVGTIVIGANPLWKQRTDMGKANNQNFASVPHFLLRRMIMYKAGAAGIKVIIQEESYTSKADVTSKDEIPVFGKPGSEKAVFSGKRIKRGLYCCADGSLVNADCNGAANILRKAVPDAWKDVSDFRFLAYPEAVTYQGLNRCRAAV